MAFSSEAFMNQPHFSTGSFAVQKSPLHLQFPHPFCSEESPHLPDVGKILTTFAASAAFALLLGTAPAFAENELSDKYGGKGFDSSLVDQTCLVDRCGSQAKACLADDPSCRKGLTCTAKCLGDNSCITGCMARYGNKNLDNLLKCTIEDHECIKIAILPGGSDKFGEEPRAPAPTVRNFDYKSMEGTWYKVVGFNPNYDCYACQRNTFAVPEQDGLRSVANSADTLQMGVEFAMPHLMPDGSPLPPKNVRESITVKDDAMFGSKSIGLNEYQTNEVMVFDKVEDSLTNLVVNKGKENEASYSRTAHSEGEMFGLSKYIHLCSITL
jgi:VDE lipocalin domain